MSRLLALALVAFLVACGSGRNEHAKTVPGKPPQPTTSVKTGTPTGPSNTNRTTTSSSR